MFFKTANTYHLPFSTFQLYPTIHNRKAWDGVDNEWKEKTIQLGGTYLGYSFSSLSSTDFMDFIRTGNRVRYENKYFAKRHALDALVLAECADNQGRFLDDIINGIFSICEESAWQLPAHNSYHRHTPQDILPDATEPVLDLFACETGAILATTYYLLKNCLNEISPFIIKRILYELQNRIVTPYLNQHFWWMGDGKESMNNWTIWCTQNILITAFLTDQTDDTKHQVFLKACKSIDYFLDEYGNDGCCDEGAQYYRHAGLCLFNAIEILNAVTNHTFKEIYKNQKIKNIAAYIYHVHIDDQYYVNFSDCSPIAGRAGSREFLFAIRTGNQDMARFAANDFKAGKQDSLMLSSENNLYYRLQNALTVTEIKNHDTSAPIRYPDLYYESVGIFSVRDSQYYLAVKSGDNADNHNHNDTGSFIIYKNGHPLMIDVGVERYTKKTFSAERYDIWTMQSAYHNLPTINGYMQKDGEDYHAKDIEWEILSSHCEIKMDIADAYPKECLIDTYKRHVILEKEKGIIISDSFTFQDIKETKEVIISLMTYEKPIIKSVHPEHTLVCIGTIDAFVLEGGIVIKIEKILITDPRLRSAWKHSIYRILIQATKNKINISIKN